MRYVFRRQRSAYALAALLCIMGVSAIFVSVWKTWPQVSSSSDPFGTFISQLGSDTFDLVPGFELRLVYVFVLADAMLIVGVTVWALSRQWILVPGKTVWYECPFCKKKWRATGDRALVHCPHCRQLVHPKLTRR
jgi:DNA-directed RNA polymerase subunit RPC12/RpoP